MFTIGIDLGGTNIAVAIVSEEGKIIRKGSVPTLSERAYTAIINDMIDLTEKLMKEQGISIDDIHSIGIGSPGIVNNSTGMIEYANNLKFKDVPIRQEIQKRLNKPVYIGNDANVAAYGEYENGAGELYKDLVAITLGTGVGGGIIVDGKLLTGSFNGGAEIGHMVLEVGGTLCTCGRKGCWECYSSATGLIQEAKRVAEEHPESMLNELVKGDLNKMNAKIPFDAAQAGDSIAQKVIDWYIKYLSIGLVNTINIFQPEVIVLGGGVSAQKEKLIEPLKKEIISEIYGGEEAFKTEIKVAELGNDAGIIGAALLYKMYA